MARPKKIPPISAPTNNVSTAAEWMTQQANQDLLRLIICGDVAENWDFSSPRRKFIVTGISPHEPCISNIVSAASGADVALLLIDAREGMLAQTRSDAFLMSLAGIRHIVVAINKMDSVSYDHLAFDAIEAEFDAAAESLGFESITAIPLSGPKGDNITARSAHTPWYQGPTLMAGLETIAVNPQTMSKVVFPVQWVNHPNVSFLGFSGTLASGTLTVGDEVRVTASGQVAKVERIVTADGDLQKACAGNAITLVLNHEVRAARGDVIASADQPLEMTDQFEATLVWMRDEPGLMGRAYEIKLANQSASASITALKYRIDVNTQAHESCRQLALNDVAVANLALSKPLVFDGYADCRTLGSFILIDKFSHATVAAGMIRHNLRRAQNVHRQALSITREDRERLNGHQGKVIWFTGLSGSGKSTIANALEKELNAQGKRTYILDGDNIRQGLNRDLGFTDADRVENIRRVAEVARLMMDAGLIVMTAFISPFRAERQMARELIGEDNFIEVFVDTPLAVCEQRDPKGLYKKARSGQLPNMTGVDSPYEAPAQPELIINTTQLGLEKALSSVDEFLAKLVDLTGRGNNAH